MGRRRRSNAVKLHHTRVLELHAVAPEEQGRVAWALAPSSNQPCSPPRQNRQYKLFCVCSAHTHPTSTSLGKVEARARPMTLRTLSHRASGPHAHIPSSGDPWILVIVSSSPFDVHHPEILRDDKPRWVLDGFPLLTCVGACSAKPCSIAHPRSHSTYMLTPLLHAIATYLL